VLERLRGGAVSPRERPGVRPRAFALGLPPDFRFLQTFSVTVMSGLLVLATGLGSA
jgi:hypothetical protein